MATILIRFTQSPYGSAISQDGLDFTLAATNYGHNVIVLFEGEGVLQLTKTPSGKGIKNHSKRLASMPFFDIEDCYVCKDSAEKFQIHTLFENTQVIEELEAQFVTAHERVALVKKADHVVTF